MIYAPVIIPTLCRFEHFKNCLESLSACTGAEFTDVFIGLDYPAKDKHWDGYNKIKNWLKKKNFTFKNLIVVERECNFGFGPNGNLASLRRDVFKKYDRVILSEDDNIFSPCFLEFINKGLDLYKEDPSVLAINGYRHDYPIKSGSNTFFRQNVNFSAWGYGLWREKYERMPETNYFEKTFSLKKFFQTKKDVGGNRAYDYWSFFFKPTRSWHDSALSVFAYLNNMDVIMPSKISLVRNVGWDASGEHSIDSVELCQKHLDQPISSQKHFQYIGNGFEFYKENRRIMKDYSYARISEFTFWKKFVKNCARYVLKNFRENCLRKKS